MKMKTKNKNDELMPKSPFKLLSNIIAIIMNNIVAILSLPNE